MSSFTYTEGSTEIANQQIDWLRDPIGLMLVREGYPAKVTDVSLTLAAAYEIQVGGYARRTLSGKTITKDTDRTIFGARDPAIWTLAPGGNPAGAVVFADRSSPEDSCPIFFLAFQSFPTNGSTFRLEFGEPGIAYIEN